MKPAPTVMPWQREYFSPGYKITFLNAIYLRMQAGESVGRSLSAVIHAERNPNKLRDMTPALEALEQGESVSCAIEKLGFFNSTVLAILHAGERSGMKDAINSATTHLTLKQAWLRQHALVIFILLNELLSAVFAPVVLYREILPWIREHSTPPTAADALLKYQSDMAIAENLTVGLIGLTVLLLIAGAINVYRISRLQATTRVLMFFSDGAMSVGFRLAAAMLKAGVTIEDVARDLAAQSPGWSRRFWASVHRQLQWAIEPAQALLQPGLYPDERSLLASHANARQLAEIMRVLSNDREQKAKRGRDLLLVSGTVLTITYIFMCMGIAIWVYMTYNSALSAGIDALSNGF
jgi:type II secretory pathway component PulF